MSTYQIARGDFVEIVQSVLAETKLKSQQLELEITESALMRDDKVSLEVLRNLRGIGASIALDDFGTGYSSLSYLKMFAFDKLKIDKSFIDDVTAGNASTAIVAATIMLARSFDITTTAEGVETLEQLEVLRASSVTTLQGYLFGRPKEISEWDMSNGRLFLSPPPPRLLKVA